MSYFLRLALPHRAASTSRMILFRSSGVVPAQRAACARPAAAFPPRRPSATAAGFFRRFAIRGTILPSSRAFPEVLAAVHRYTYSATPKEVVSEW
jgi:hypothetical protein